MGTIAFPNIAQDSATTAAQNSLAEYDRAAALRQQSAMEAQQTQALQLQNQQTQGVNQAYKDAFKPDATGNLTLDTNQLQQSLAQNGHGAAIPGIMKGITDYKKQMADLQDSQQKLQTGARDALGSLGYSLQQAKYDPQLAHTMIQDEMNDPSIPAQTKQQLAQWQQQITQNPALIQSMADQWVAQSPAQQAKIPGAAKARLDDAQAAHQEYLNTITQNAKPSDFEKVIDGLYDPDDKATGGLNRQTKLMVFNAFQTGGLPAAQKVMDSAFQNVLGVQKDIAVGTNPQIQAGKVAVSTAEGVARANTEATIARGSDAALAKVPPRLVPAATAAADKADLDYAQAQSVSQRLQAMMTAAKNGNVVSYQLIPQEGALQVTTSQGVHRINMAEIQNYGGGSLWQRLQGHIGKQLTGASIPVSVLNDMAEMQQIQAEGSQTKYNNALKSINARYGSTFAPVEMDKIPANGGAQPQGGSGKPAGATHTAPGNDGKMHYTNAQGQDLGVAQ